MSRSAYSRIGLADPTCVWLDDTSFVALMGLSWLATKAESEPQWIRYRDHCIEQILICGFGILASGLDLLGGASDRAHLAELIEALVSHTEQQGLTEIDTSPLFFEFEKRGQLNELDGLPHLGIPLAKALCSFIGRFLRLTDSEVAQGIDQHGWWDIYMKLYNTPMVEPGSF